jgi:prevent-host-death family protein
MREMTVREANQNVSRLIATAEQGETIVVTKNGVPVASIAPQSADRSTDPEWRAAYEDHAADAGRSDRLSKQTPRRWVPLKLYWCPWQPNRQDASNPRRWSTSVYFG